MTSEPPTNDGESAGIKMEQNVVEGEELISSSLPQLEISIKSLTPSPRPKTPSDSAGTGDKPKSAVGPRSARQAAAEAASKRAESTKTARARSAAFRQTSSSIPLPIHKNVRAANPPPKVSPSHNTVRTASAKTVSKPGATKLPCPSATRHNLEMLFGSKKKKLVQMQKDLIDKQKPVLELYENLLQIKKKLEELGKSVTLEEVKLVSIPVGEGMHPPPQKSQPPGGVHESPAAGGESVPPEVVNTIQCTIEEIPNTLMDICKNLLARRNVIVDLLESIIKSEVDVENLSEQIETLKIEGVQLQNNLDVVINEHNGKIKEIVKNWKILLSDKAAVNSTVKIADIEEKMKAQEKLYEESKKVIQDLQNKLDDKKHGNDRYITDLNNVIGGLKEQIQKLEQDLEAEKKSTQEFKSRNTSNAQASKTLRNKINELENEKKSTEHLNAELTKKVRLLQDQMKHKETQWNKEKEDITKTMKHQENMMQKLAAEKTNFETRIGGMKDQCDSVENSLRTEIEEVLDENRNLISQTKILARERDEALEKCEEMSIYIAGMGKEDVEAIYTASQRFKWGEKIPVAISNADKIRNDLLKDVIIQQYKDEMTRMEEEINMQRETINLMKANEQLDEPTEAEKKVVVQNDSAVKYKHMLALSEMKLSQKSEEVQDITTEVQQLKVRQDHMEAVHQQYPPDTLIKMIDEGKHKLEDLTKRAMESEQKVLHKENIIEKQAKQINEMENQLRYRENMTSVLKAAKNELFIEKASLTKYSQEMRTVLAEVTKESKMKDRLIKDLQEKIDARGRKVAELEKEIQALDNKLAASNEKRFKLQETVQSLERDLQSTKSHVTQLADINTRYDLGMKSSSSISFSTLKTSSIEDNSTSKVEKTKENWLKHQNNELNCTSLIGISLKQVDYLKNRLNYLTQVNSPPLKDRQLHQFHQKPRKPSLKKLRVNLLKTESSHSDIFKKLNLTKESTHSRSSKVSSSTSSKALTVFSGRHKNLAKVMELTAKRYEYLQQQAYESYDELTNLMKLAASSSKLSIS